jgi:hypothetical protein
MKRQLIYPAILWLAIISISAKAQQPLFNEYRTEVYKGKAAKIIFKNNPTAKMFRTAIRDTYYGKDYIKKWDPTGLNFAGHYCFVSWGCGSPCQSAAIVDLKTGIVYDAPSASYGYKFKRNSRLVIINPDKVVVDGKVDTTCVGCISEYWLWNERTKKFVKVK